MTLNPNPSVQANRYTYANAAPLTHTDPTGHWGETYTGKWADPDYEYAPGEGIYSWGNENVGDGLPNLIHDDFDYYYEHVYLPVGVGAT
ncbi:hypothetical protein [Nonomuraea glycinis]|uniref:hypothetical protein n=1 Tax=Nonomuraea glycinis TaxID=2047744 RepID=UPI0033A5BF9B